MSRRYILIENNSGFVFGDTSDLPGFSEAVADVTDDHEAATIAARLVDADIGGEYGRTYEAMTTAPRSTIGGYHVYSAPAAFPVCTDGQDQSFIDAVQRDCKVVCFVARGDGIDE